MMVMPIDTLPRKSTQEFANAVTNVTNVTVLGIIERAGQSAAAEMSAVTKA
jgi:hypothetical protein